MRHHLAVRASPDSATAAARWEAEAPRILGGAFELRRIRPSLEDVFIRLVEGSSR
jgi:hypothetical protein